MPAPTATSTRFHRAARDGLLDVILEVSSKDANLKDELGMSPTLWAAFNGQTHVLRVLISKGGIAGNMDVLGNTALHLAAVNGHAKCVAFLCAMGEDVWALNIDKRTPRDMAATHPEGEAALRLLDATMARELALDSKRCAAKRQRANQRADKCLNAFQRSSDDFKRKQLEERRNLVERSGAGSPVHDDDATSLNSSSAASSTVSAVWAAMRNTNKRRSSTESNASSVARSFNFGVGSVNTDGSRTIRPISGLAPSTEVLYSGGALAPRRHSVQSTGSSMATESMTDAYDLALRNQGSLIVLTPSDTEKDSDEEVFDGERRSSSMFDRPGFGHVAFRHSIAGMEDFVPSADAISNWSFKKPSPDVTDSSNKEADHADQDPLHEYEEVSPLVSFLVAWDLEELAHVITPSFKDDLEALLMATEIDLKLAGLVTGPRKKLLRAIAMHNEELENHGPPEDTRL